ncbi:MAG: Acetyltransferase, ribosomal protein N-acetylase [Nocardioidaceae bacterium]|nr:Acetyltransferase, ribosomal protein N-acetylase [Nocardioidaceae bacterium]
MIAETDRFVVRPWRLDEAPRLLDLLGRIEVAKWLGDGEPVLMKDLAEARDRVHRYEERSLVSPLGVWAVVPHDTGVPAGTVLLVELPNGAGEVEVGWHLHPDAHGKGYATESARLVLDRGFGNGLPEVYATTHLGNHPSQAVCRRLGMEDLGEMVRWYDVPSQIFRVTRGQWATRETPTRP